MQEEINNGTIKNEFNIETRVAVITDKERDEWAAAGLPRYMSMPRLLTILGYEEKDMERQRSIKVGSVGRTIIPDFIMSSDGKEFFVLDVKVPNVNLDEATGQIFDYLFSLDMALGILFNSKEMDVYVNSRPIKQRTDANNGSPKPLRVIRASGVEQLTEIWCRFFRPTSDELKPRRGDLSFTVAKVLKREHEKEIEGHKRRREIGQWLSELLANPV